MKTHRCPPRRGETRDLAHGMSSSSSDGSNATESDDDEFFATVHIAGTVVKTCEASIADVGACPRMSW